MYKREIRGTVGTKTVHGHKKRKFLTGRKKKMAKKWNVKQKWIKWKKEMSLIETYRIYGYRKVIQKLTAAEYFGNCKESLIKFLYGSFGA